MTVHQFFPPQQWAKARLKLPHISIWLSFKPEQKTHCMCQYQDQYYAYTTEEAGWQRLGDGFPKLHNIQVIDTQLQQYGCLIWRCRNDILHIPLFLTAWIAVGNLDNLLSVYMDVHKSWKSASLWRLWCRYEHKNTKTNCEQLWAKRQSENEEAKWDLGVKSGKINTVRC